MSNTIRLINTNPIGDVDVPILGRSLLAGETFDVDVEVAGRGPAWRSVVPGDVLVGHETRVVDDVVELFDLGAGLLSQVGNYAIAPDPVVDVDAMKLDQLVEYAAANEIDLDGATKKADVLAVIKAADTGD